MTHGQQVATQNSPLAGGSGVSRPFYLSELALGAQVCPGPFTSLSWLTLEALGPVSFNYSGLCSSDTVSERASLTTQPMPPLPYDLLYSFILFLL